MSDTTGTTESTTDSLGFDFAALSPRERYKILIGLSLIHI